MCGISGIFSTTNHDVNALAKMTGALTHRGPDANGIFVSENCKVGLGHTRLSIIDLSTAANQPFFSQCREYVLVFNGEVYNFEIVRKEISEKFSFNFRTNSDTEVIVEGFRLFGKNIVEKLEGMFAFAIYDVKRNKLFLCRDRVGKKPLYFFQSDNLFAFASELKSLLKHPEIDKNREINQSVISTFVHLGYIPEPNTIYQHIYKFPSGHFAEVDASLVINKTKYWALPDKIQNIEISDSVTAKQKLKTLLTESVSKRLISDVPLGAFLSGGTDSSLVCAIAASQISRPLKTFSIGFKESKFDERSYAKQVAAALCTEHTDYVLAEREGIDLLDQYLRQFDEPFADTSAIPTMLVSRLAKREVTVALTGDGGDELFQGYGSYPWAERLDQRHWKFFRPLIKTALKLSGNSRLQRVSHMFEKIDEESIRSHIFSQEQYFFSNHEIGNSLLKHKSHYIPYFYMDSLSLRKKLSSKELQAVFDFQVYLKDDLLVKVDRASMTYGLECRCPLLDHHLVEFAYQLDIRLKTYKGISKWILKDLLNDYLPSNLVYRQKWGFGIPLAAWLKNDLRFLIDKFLDKRFVEEANIFDPKFTEILKQDFFKGKDYLYNRLWIIIVLHKWWNENH